MVQTADPVLSLVRREDVRVLDLFCGAGHRGRLLKDGDLARVVWGTEPDQAAASAARSHLDRVISGDPERLDPFPFPKQYFECVLFYEGFDRLKDPIAFLRRLHTPLAPNGRIIVRVPNPGHWTAMRDLLSGKAATGSRLALPPREVFFEAGYRIVSELTGLFRDDSVEPLVFAAKALGLEPDSVRATLETAETVFVIEPMAGVIDHGTAGSLGPATLKGTSVIVLTYNSLGTIDDCLNSVLPTLGGEDELIVVDDASRDGTADRVELLLRIGRSDPNAEDAERDFRTNLIRNESNLGFSAGCNAGIRASHGTTICLLNPDTIVYPGWLGGLRTRLEDPTVGMVGPLSDNVAGVQNVRNWLTEEQLSRPLDLSHFAGRSTGSRLIIGLCAMLRRETLDLLGLLDEILFLGSDDLEMSWRLRTHGLKLMVAQDVFVHHLGGRSFASEDRTHIARLLYESTEACLAKIRMACGWRPPDRLLWGFDIAHT